MADQSSLPSQSPKEGNPIQTSSAQTIIAPSKKPSSPSARCAPVSPSPFDAFLIKVEVRTDPSLGLSDPPSYIFQLPVPLLLHDTFKYIPSEKIRPSHLSWDIFRIAVQRKCGFELDFSKCELGFTAQSAVEGLGTEYFKISSELTFQNALGVSFNNWEWVEQPIALPLRLWNPKPQPSSNARANISSTDDIVIEHNSGPDNDSSMPSSRAASGNLADPNLEDGSTGTKQSRTTFPQSPKQHEEGHESDDHNTLYYISDDDGYGRNGDNEGDKEEDEENEEEGFIDTQYLLDHLPGDQMQLPDREDFESEDEFQEALEDYVNYIQRLELARLQEGCNSEACMHFNDKIWTEVCRFFHHDVALTKPEYCVKVPGGFLRTLLPVQMHGVWHSLREIHGIAGSVFLCHIMGIGKTTMALAIHHIQHTFNKMWSHIYNPKNTGRHYSKARSSEPCPSNNRMLTKYGFDCPCHPASPGHWLKEKLGISVAMVPLGLLNVWKYEHQQCFGDDGDCHFVRAHGSARSDRMTSELQALLRGEVVSRGDQKHRSIYKGTLSNGSVFVVSTPDSFESQFLDSFTICKKWMWTPEPTRHNGKVTRHRPKEGKTPNFFMAVVSILFRDEFQLRKSPTRTAIQQLQRLQNKHLALLPKQQWEDAAYHRLSIVAMSGTPLMMGPGDIAFLVELMSWPGWSQDDVLRDWMENELEALGMAWNAWTVKKTHDPNDQTPHNINARLSPLVEKLMIRWTTSSKLCGQNVVEVPKNKFEDFECDNGDYWNRRLESLGDDERRKLEFRESRRRTKWLQTHSSLAKYVPLDKTNINIYYRSRVCASFPYLMDVKDETDKPIKLSEGEWIVRTRGDKKKGIKPTWVPESNSDPYFKNLHAIVKSSAKLKKIEEKVREFKNFKDGENKEPRHIFFSYFFAGGYIMYLWMKHILKIPQEDLIWIYKPLGQTAIDRELDRFHVNLESDVPFEKQHTARFLIATSSSFAVGLTLAEAISVGSLEPDFHADTIAQAFHRHCRQGNKNKIVYSWMFSAKNNKTETRIQEVSKLRKLIENAASRKVNVAIRAKNGLASDIDLEIFEDNEVEV